MRTNPITVKGSGEGVKEALALTEGFGRGSAFGEKEILRMRLLAEELFGLLRGLAGDVCAKYWIEQKKKEVEFHLESSIEMTDELRDQFIDISKNKKNEAEKTFTGKLKVLIADIMLSAKQTLPYAMMNTVSAYPDGGTAGEAVWLMSDYRDEIRRHIDDSKEAADAWDELERSILANVSDDIRVSVVGQKVGIVVLKSF